MKTNLPKSMLQTAIVAALLMFSQFGFAQPGYFGKFFIHEATSANQISNSSIMNHPDLNGNSAAKMIVTSNWDVAGVYNNFNFGVWYSGGTWKIYNENTSDTIPVGSGFNVLIPSENGTTFTHTSDTNTATKNVYNNYTLINHDSLNSNPNAIFFITHNWGNSGKYNNHSVGVWYNGSKWGIYNEDDTDFPHGAKYDIFVPTAGNANAFKHEVDTMTNTNPGNNYTLIDNALTNNQPGRVVFVTHNWETSGVYNESPVGVWYNGAKWSIFNQDLSDMPHGAVFNVLVADTMEITGVSNLQQHNPTMVLFPNPTSENLTIGYVLNESSNVLLKLVSVDGREIETLYQGNQSAGNYTIQRSIAHLASGTYFYILNQNGNISRKTLVKN